VGKLMLLVAAIAVWALVLGFSPGLALIAITLTVLALDRYDPALIDRFVIREPK
jgi:hypothetical protein